MSGKFERAQFLPGKISFEIIDFDPKYISKSGNEMKKVSFMVIDSAGTRGMLWGYYGGAFLNKYKDMLLAIDRPDLLDRESFDPNIIIGLAGQAILKLEDSTNPSYPGVQERLDRFLKHYREEAAATPLMGEAYAKANHSTDELTFDDDIPF